MQSSPTARSLRRAAALIGLAAAAGAHAQSSVTLYGLVDMSAGQFQNAGESKIKKAESGNFSTSYVGFSGTEDLGGGLQATFQLESFLLADTGSAGRFGGDVFWARDANVGLAGPWGSLRAGRASSPLFVPSLVFNPFGDSFGYSPTIRQWYNNQKGPFGSSAFLQTPLVGDSGWGNSVFYSTPNFGGLSGNFAVEAGEGGTNKGPNWGGNLIYFGDAFSGTVAYQHVEADGVGGNHPGNFAGFDQQTAYQVGAAYDFKVVKLYGQFGRIKTDATTDATTKIYQVGASVPIGAGALLASFGHSKLDTGGLEKTNKTLTVGYDYNLSKRTDLYAIYLRDQLTGYNTGNTFALGVRHKF